MDRIIPIMVIILVDKFIHGKPISSGFSFKLNPIYVQDDFGAEPEPILELYPQDSSKEVSANERKFLHKVSFPRYGEYGMGSTKQIAKILFPSNPVQKNYVQQDGFIKIPVAPQTFSNYKIIIATAPWNMKISGREAEPIVVYVVFPDDADDYSDINVVPSIFFVKKKSELLDLSKRDQLDPIIVIDNNRTVTGLKSAKVAKFIKFKNKLIHRDNYEVSR